MSSKMIYSSVAVVALAAAAWMISHRNSNPTASAGAKLEIAADGPGDAGSATEALADGDINWSSYQENPPLGASLTDTFRGKFAADIEKSNPEWVQETREAFVKFDAMHLKEARIEPELGVTTPAIFYTLVKTDGTVIQDEARELPINFPFPMAFKFENNRAIIVKTESAEQPSPDTTKSFANALVAIVNRETSKTETGPLSSGE